MSTSIAEDVFLVDDIREYMAPAKDEKPHHNFKVPRLGSARVCAGTLGESIDTIDVHTKGIDRDYFDFFLQ